MTAGPTSGSEAQSAAERLLEESWQGRARRASRRELVAESAAGALFLAAAGGLAVTSGALAATAIGVAALMVGLYALVARIEFPVGAGHVVPTQLVLVPMLVVLPPGVVPLAVASGLVASTAVDVAMRRASARRIVSAVPDGWHALGPAVVLVAAGSPRIGFDALLLLAAALAAGCAVDLISSLARMQLTAAMPGLRALAGVMVQVWSVDACLAPLGFLAASATEHGLAAVLFVLPLAVLLWLLARDRFQRIEQANARLRLVEHERGRLQSAVRRLGDAFAAKLELDGLFEILLHGSIEALDADAGRLELTDLPSSAGAIAIATPGWQDSATIVLSLPVGVAGGAHAPAGVLQLARAARPFEADEVALVRELVAKAEHAAAEILAHEALREQARTDALTGLGNRRQLTSDLGATLERATPDNAAVLLLFDLDGFKGYNDTFGHLAGDQLLARLGHKLAAAAAPGGRAYRLGGDEFCALIDLSDVEDLDRLIEHTRSALTETGEHFAVGASLGTVVLPHEADSPDHAIQLADQRMYAAKHSRSAGPRDQARNVLMRAMQARQPDLDEHAGEVATLAIRVARRLGLTGETLDEIARAAELHDVGKVGIPDAILTKPAPLDDTEWQYMHQHTILGERILNAAPALRPVARLVRSSHERWDGTGYPDRLSGQGIPLGARIIAVCDAYEAMTADRPYRQALSDPTARNELRANAGTQFDPAVVAAFLDASDTPERPTQASHDDAAAHVHAVLQQHTTANQHACVVPRPRPLRQC